MEASAKDGRQTRNRSRRQVQLLYRRLEQHLPRGIRLAEFSHLRWANLSIARQLHTLEAFQLAFTRRLHASADRLGILHVALVGQLFFIDAGDLDVDVDTVQQWAADLLLVARDGSTTTLFHRTPVEAAGASVRLAVGASN